MQLVNKRDIKDRNVAKAQPLVEAAYNFSLWEKRVYTILASLVDKKDPDFKSYRINIRDIIDFYECKSHDAYERIREVPESLLTKNKIIQIPYTSEEGHKRILKTHLITAITEPADGDTSEGNGYIELEFHPRLKPFLLGLKRYLCYDIKNTIGISSVHTLRIFEFLKLHQYKGQHKITVQDLKIMLGLEEKHKKYGHFKRVIVKAQKDLKKHTDIRFEFEEIKQGRAVHALLFFIYENVATQEVSSKSTLPTDQTIQKTGLKDGESLYQLVKGWGVTRETFLGFMEQYALDHIKERINYIQQLPKKNTIRNRAAYLRTILEQPTLFTTPKITQKRKQENSQARKKKEALVEANKKQLVELRKEQSKAENEVIDQLFKNDVTILENIITQTKKSRLAKNKFDEVLTDEENFYQNTGFQLFVYAEAKKTYPELLKKVQVSYQKKIAALKRLV
ncbi:MAG: replication initiation protein [Aureispira sp.]